jgi:hypothetical protein
MSDNWIAVNHTAREFFCPLDLDENNLTFLQPGPRTAATLVALLHDRWRGASVEVVTDCGGTNDRAYDIEYGELGQTDRPPYQKLTGPMLRDIAERWSCKRAR